MREVEGAPPVAGKKAADESDALKRIAIAAARAGTLEPRAADRIGRRVLRQVLSSEPLTARHAMAMAVEVARKVTPPSAPRPHLCFATLVQSALFLKEGGSQSVDPLVSRSVSSVSSV